MYDSESSSVCVIEHSMQATWAVKRRTWKVDVGGSQLRGQRLQIL